MTRKLCIFKYDLKIMVMSRLRSLMVEINEVTNEISSFYNEVYPFLAEDTVTIPSQDKDLVNEKYFEDYLESLREILHHHKLTHRTKGGEMMPT